MIDIRNRLFQPLTFNLIDGSTLHLGVRGKKAIPENLISDEVRKAATRGLIEVIGSKSQSANPSDNVSQDNEPNTPTKRRK